MNSKKKSKSNSNSYLKYAGLASQLLVLLLVLAWIGKKIDQYFQNETLYFTAFLTVIGLMAFFYKVYLDLDRDRK